MILLLGVAGVRCCHLRGVAGVFAPSQIKSLLASVGLASEVKRMKNYSKIVFSVLTAVICATAFAADQPKCKTSGKNCPMNDGKECNCGKDCDCK